MIADDDLVLPPEYLYTAYEAFRTHPDASFIGGKVLPKWSADPPEWLTPDHHAALALGDYGEAELYTAAENPLCLLAGIFRTADVRSVEGYNLGLGVSGGLTGGVEDVEIYNRLFKAGKRGLYVPQLVVYHKVAPAKMTQEYHRRWHYGHGTQFARLRDPQVEAGRFRLFDVPAYMYREGVEFGLRWLALRMRGNSNAAFVAEMHLRYLYGFFTQRRADFRAAGGSLRAELLSVFRGV